MVSNGSSFINATLPDYNILNLKNEYRFEKNKEVIEEYFLENDEETIIEIATKNNINFDNIYYKIIKDFSGSKNHNLYPITTSLNYWIKKRLKRINNGTF